MLVLEVIVYGFAFVCCKVAFHIARVRTIQVSFAFVFFFFVFCVCMRVLRVIVYAFAFVCFEDCVSYYTCV